MGFKVPVRRIRPACQPYVRAALARFSSEALL